MSEKQKAPELNLTVKSQVIPLKHLKLLTKLIGYFIFYISLSEFINFIRTEALFASSYVRTPH